MDFETFGQPGPDGDVNNAHQSGSNQEMGLSNEEIHDVMKVLTDLDGYDVEKNLDALTSVQDVSKVVDKVAMGNEKCQHVMGRQQELERRFSHLTRRISQMRVQKFSSHVTKELISLRSYCDKVIPSPPLTTPLPVQMQQQQHQQQQQQQQQQHQQQQHSVNMSPFSFPVQLRPPLMPEGVFLPSTPTPQLAPSLPQTPLTLQDIKIKEESDNQTVNNALITPVKSLSRVPAPTIDEKHKTDEVLGQLDAGLRHLVENYDSDATETSSGGESCEDYEDCPSTTPVETETRTLAIKKRARWRWLASRASVASRWSWLTAQISDLEYRIRQQTDYYRQIRASKGFILLEDPPAASNLHQSRASSIRNAVQRMDESGRRIILKEPIDPDLNENDPSTSCRTRPIHSIRKRHFICTKNFYRTSTRAAKESTIRCDCVNPTFWCSICYGRTNHVQTPDPSSQDRGKMIALLDHSYHQVLSSKTDAPLEIHMLQKLKDRNWLQKAASNLTAKNSAKMLKDQQANKERLEEKRKLKLKKKLKERLDPEAKKRKKLLREMDRGERKKLKLMKQEKRRKSLSVQMDTSSSVMVDLTATGSGDFSEISNQPQTPLTPSLTMAEQLRRKREAAYDIDNIVIPYSMAAAVRVEKLKYKEILTPTWRVADEDCKAAECDEQPSTANAALEEDLSDTLFEIRHLKAEIDERKRWQLPPNKSIGGRSRRQDSRAEASSGCNTPDPLSPGIDSIEVSTRPSTPVNDDSNLSTNSLAAGIRNRRRTSSATKSRDRNPSEDTQSSRCTSPVVMEPLQEDILPYEPRKFPLTDEEVSTMLEEMPDGFDLGTPDEEPMVGEPVAPPEGRSSPTEAPFSSRSSSPCEETEDDPDWCADDPDDPEWTGDIDGMGGQKESAPPLTKRRSSNNYNRSQSLI